MHFDVYEGCLSESYVISHHPEEEKGSAREPRCLRRANYGSAPFNGVGDSGFAQDTVKKLFSQAFRRCLGKILNRQARRTASCQRQPTCERGEGCQITLKTFFLANVWAYVFTLFAYLTVWARKPSVWPVPEESREGFYEC